MFEALMMMVAMVLGVSLAGIVFLFLYHALIFQPRARRSLDAMAQMRKDSEARMADVMKEWNANDN